MPKSKKDEGAGGSEDTDPPSKKAKSDSSAKGQSTSGGGDDNPEWILDAKKKVTIKEFKGTVYIDIREWYDAGGELKPGKKGISLSAQSYQKLKSVIPEIDEALKKH